MKKGFTLIELLAVIVILAIIAVITVPMIVDVVDENESQALSISAEFYAKAVEEAIMSYNLNGEQSLNPSVCNINEDGNVTCDGIDLEIKVKGEKPTSGKIVFELKKIKNVEIDFQGVTIVQNNTGTFVDSDLLICKAAESETQESVDDGTAVTTGNIPQGNFAIGDEYICEVKEGLNYHFFVLSVENEKVNLILDRNIYSDGTLASYFLKETDDLAKQWNKYNIVQWVSKEHFIEAGGTEEEYGSQGNNTKGPITVLKFIEKATSTWNKLENLNEVYKDEGTMYPNIKLTGKARLPKQSEILNTSCKYGSTAKGTCPLWLVNYLQQSTYYTQDEKYNVSRLKGYWTLASHKSTNLYITRTLDADGHLSTGGINTEVRGVRPVIQVSKDKFY